MIWKLLLLVFGVFTCSTAVLMIKACTMDAVLLASYRLLVAVVFLMPLFLRDWKRHASVYSRRHVWRTIIPGLFLGGHFITWIIGARLTLAANASLIVNFLPVAMPFLLYFMLHERITKGELFGTVFALGGVLLLAGVDFNLSANYFEGDVWVFGSMLLQAVYFALGRRNRDYPTIWLYVVPLYFFAGVGCLLAALPFISPLSFLEGEAGAVTMNILMTLGLAAVPTVLGHSIMNWCMRHMRGQLVSIGALGQFIFAAPVAWLLWPQAEAPNWNFYAASLLVVAGAVLAVRGSPPQPTLLPPEE